MSMRSEWNGEHIKEKIRAAETRALDLSGRFVVGVAALLCPVGVYPEGSGKVGGNLRSSLTHEVVAGSHIVRVGSPVAYGPRIEFGFSGTDSLGRTYHQAAQPYMRPALSKKTEIKAIYAEEYKAAMK